jgi:hypothetical protein
MKVTPKVLAEMAMTEVANDRPGEAMIYLWLLRDMLGSVTVELDVKEEPDLPPMQRMPGKRIKSTDIVCPTCKAGPSSPCFRMSTRGPSGKPTKDVLRSPNSGKSMIHKRRVDAARELNR